MAAFSVGTSDADRPSPGSPRGEDAGALQAHLLLLIACLPILGMLVIAPILPEMQRYFAQVEGVAYLIPFALTAPALMIVLVSPFAGRIAARTGRKNALVGALLFYFVTATAPLWLDSLPAIIVSRLGVGIAEAILMTVSTMLLGDYFEPRRRDRYLAYQVIYTSASAVIFLVIGGVLGESGWRTPFFAYVAALVLLPFVLVLIREPRVEPSDTPGGFGPMPWRLVLPVCAVTFFAGGCMNLVSVDLGYLLEKVGAVASTTKGIGAAVNSAGIAAGAALAARVSARPSVGQVAAAFLLGAAGFAGLALSGSAGVMIASGGIVGLASGFYLGWLIGAVNRPLTSATRGRGVGLWMSSYFLATILAPFSAVALSGTWGGLQPAMLFYAALLLALAAVAPAALRGGKV